MIKSIVLVCVLGICSMNSVVHAQDNKSSKHEKNNKKKEKKQEKKDDDVTVLDMSDTTGEDSGDGMPAITPKGKAW